jgi:hypothetical protein
LGSRFGGKDLRAGQFCGWAQLAGVAAMAVNLPAAAANRLDCNRGVSHSLLVLAEKSSLPCSRAWARLLSILPGDIPGAECGRFARDAMPGIETILRTTAKIISYGTWVALPGSSPNESVNMARRQTHANRS